MPIKKAMTELPKVFGFVLAKIEHPDDPKKVPDLVAVFLSEDGKWTGNHVGESHESILNAWAEVWLKEARMHYPLGFDFEWVEHPEMDTRIQRANELMTQEDPLLVQMPGAQFLDDAGNSDGVEHLFDSTGIEVVPGMIFWEPKDLKADGDKLSPIGRIESTLVKAIHFGKGVVRQFGDPSIAGTEKMAYRW